MKNAHTHKSLISKIIISLLICFLIFSLVQFSPVSAQEETAIFTGTIYDEGVDTDGDGYFDYLNIGVEVNVTTPATYTVDGGGLYNNSTSTSITLSDENSTYLDAGIQVVDLHLNGTRIYTSDVSPTHIASIYLYDENNNTLDEMFSLPLSEIYSFTQFQRPIFDIRFDEVSRNIMLSQDGKIRIANSYHITNVGYEADTIELGFPDGAFNFEVRDEMGALDMTTENNVVTVTLRSVVATNTTETLHLIYYVPWETYITQQNGADYSLQFTFFDHFNVTLGKLSVSIDLPQGAQFQSSTPQTSAINKNSQEVLSFTFSDVTPSQDLNFKVNYRYLVVWGSFYPTIWAGILAAVAIALVYLFGAPKSISAPTIVVPSKDLKSFVDSYEEKINIQSEIDSLENRLQKRKIPRRRYKVRKKILDGRLSKITRNLADLRESIRAAGSKYATLMRQIEVAETSFEDAERDLQRLDSRYKRGEVSKAAYEKLREEYQNRIEEAETTIDGVLLRLRE